MNLYSSHTQQIYYNFAISLEHHIVNHRGELSC